MSVFNIKKAHAWNYSNSRKDGFSEELNGTITGIDNPQARDFQTGKPRYWDDGTPVRNIRVFVDVNNSGEERTVTFRPKGALFDAFVDAINALALDSFEDIPGHAVHIETPEGSYNLQNPRPWAVKLGEINPSVKLHKIPVLDYDTVDPVTGQESIPFN